MPLEWKPAKSTPVGQTVVGGKDASILQERQVLVWPVYSMQPSSAMGFKHPERMQVKACGKVWHALRPMSGGGSAAIGW
jgi:hypothetical protein